jgi:hypothetical protein
MIPAGQESGTGRRVDRDGERSAEEQLVRAVRQLIATAESDLRPSEKLDLLRVQIGTLEFWADRLAPVSPAVVPVPHFGEGRVSRA